MAETSPPIEPESLVQHVSFVRSLACGLLRDEHAVEDIVNETMVVALEARVPPRSGVRPWLSGVARNLVRRRWRTEERRRRREVASTPPRSAESPADVAGKLEITRRVLREVDRLDEPYRTTIVRRFYDDLTPAEIARREGIPAPTVRTRLRRALEMLRERLDRSHRGGRRAWILALFPLAYPERAASVASRAPRTPRSPSIVRIGGMLALGLIGGFLLLTWGGDVPEVEASIREDGRVVGRGAGLAGASRGSRDDGTSVPDPASVARVTSGTPIVIRGPDGREVARARLHYHEHYRGLTRWRTYEYLRGEGRLPLHGANWGHTTAVPNRTRYFVEIRGVADDRGEALPLAPLLLGPEPPGVSPVDVTLAPGRTIDGSVLDAGGRPVPGVTVTVTPLYEQIPDRFALRPRGEIVTAEDGRFTLGPLDDVPHHLHVSAPTAWQPIGPLRVPVGANEFVVRLEEVRTLPLTIRDESGRPVSGAIVSVRRWIEDGRGTAGEGPTAVSGTDGIARLSGVRLDGTYRLDIEETEGREGLRAIGIPRWTPTASEFVLERAHVLDVTIRDRAGAPVPRARVNAKLENEGGWRRRQADAEGRLRLTQLPRGPVLLRAADEFADHHMPGVDEYRVEATAGTVALEIAVTAVLDIEIQGPPVRQSFMRIGVTFSGGAKAEPWIDLALFRRSRIRVGGLRPDALYTVFLATNPGGRYALLRDVRAGGGPIPVRLVAGHSIHGRLTLPEGIDHGTVFVRAFGTVVSPEATIDGRFEIRGLPPGTHRLEAFYRVNRTRRGETSIAASTGESVEIVLQ